MASKRRSAEGGERSARQRRRSEPRDVFLQVLADADCTVLGNDVPFLGSGDVRRLQMHLEKSLGADAPVALRETFVAGLQAHVEEEQNLRRLLKPISCSSRGVVTESVARVLLTVSSIQAQVANVLLEKLPEYFGLNDSMTPLLDSVPRMILGQFRWLEFVVDSGSITKKLLEIISIAPLNLKKEIIGFLPEIVSDSDHETVMASLERMLQEDLQIIVPVLDALSNLNLDKCLYDQVVEIALVSLRSADAEDLPLVVRFLLQSTTSENARRIIHQLRENLNFVTATDVRATRPDKKLKGKSTAGNCEALVLDALRSGLRFQHVISEAFLKEIKSVQGERNHKVVDFWLLLILHSNGGHNRKTAESLMKRKVTSHEISLTVLRQSVKGHGNSLQDYFESLVSISESLLRSKESSCLDFGVKIYILLFEEFSDTYHRQEILGSLIAHTGAGIPDEVRAALKTLLALAEDHPRELLPMSSFVNVILDYLESFPSESLHQVYRIFSRLAMACWSFGAAGTRSSVADELLIFIRKQVANPELRYKHMGIIGVINLMSCLESEDTQEKAVEAIGLLQMTLEMCKTSPVARGFFYDELALCVNSQSTHVSILDWAAKHTNEFESIFLGDLENGRIASAQSTSPPCEGELWMNLDGDASPVYLNVLPMLMSHDQSVSNSLLFLPSNFRLLAANERAINQGLLGSIDALLGCPIYLPKAVTFSGSSWVNLSRSQRDVSCIAIFYAINWIRELINAFSGHMESSCLGPGQPSVEETTEKLINRLRHLLTLEYLLADCLKTVPNIVFPQLHCIGSSQDFSSSRAEIPSLQSDTSTLKAKKKKANSGAGTQKKSGKPSQVSQEGQNSQGGQSSQPGRNSQADAQNSQAAGKLSQAGGGKLRQATIFDTFGNTDGKNSQQSQNLNHAKQKGNTTQQQVSDVLTHSILEESLGSQQWKLRPLTMSSLNLLTIQQLTKKSACCADPDAKLSVYLYLMQDLLYKLESFSKRPATTASFAVKPSGLGTSSSADLFHKLSKAFSNIRSHLDTAVAILEESKEATSCPSHWSSLSCAVGTPEVLEFSLNKTSTAKSFLYLTFGCLSKILQFSELKTQETTVKSLLMAFGSLSLEENLFSDLQLQPSADSLDYLSCSMYAYLDGLFNPAVEASHSVATELLMLLNYLVDFLKAFNSDTSERWKEVVVHLSRKLSASAGKLLQHDWDGEEPGKVWKGKQDVLRRLLLLMIQRSESPTEMIEDLSSNVMTQVSPKGGKCSVLGYPALAPATLAIWYRVQHEVLLDRFAKLVKEILSYSKQRSTNIARAEKLLESAFECISVHVSLVNLTRTQDKTSIHAIALTYGGKFVDTFLKALEFLEAYYDTHKTVINNMVKEMQKATRTIQSICSEAKGLKKMPVTAKVPAVKRSLERYVFRIKALLHKGSNGTTFWMGNLKHKDLQGNEIGSQIPVSDSENEDDGAIQEEQGDLNENATGEEDDVEEEGVRVFGLRGGGGDEDQGAQWHAVASWTWDAHDDACGICRMAFDGCCPDCKMPGDDCPLRDPFFRVHRMRNDASLPRRIDAGNAGGLLPRNLDSVRKSRQEVVDQSSRLFPVPNMSPRSSEQSTSKMLDAITAFLNDEIKQKIHDISEKIEPRFSSFEHALAKTVKNTERQLNGLEYRIKLLEEVSQVKLKLRESKRKDCYSPPKRNHGRREELIPKYDVARISSPHVKREMSTPELIAIMKVRCNKTSEVLNHQQSLIHQGM